MIKEYLKLWWALASVIVISLVSVAQAAETVTYYHTDISGSTLAASDSNGNLIWKENYKPYGDKINLQSASMDNKIGFHGKTYDNDTGLSFMGARYYEPVLGRFWGVDPKGVDSENFQTFNRYAYANNNPYKYVDPDGHSPIDVVFLAVDLGKLGVAIYQGEGIQGALTDVAISAVGVVSPIPGSGEAIKAVRAVDKAVDVVKAADKAADVARTADKAADAAKTAENVKNVLPKPPTGPGSVPKADRDPKRLFTPAEREVKREEQGHRCANCGKAIDETNSKGHHIERHADGGPTTPENHAEVCNPCHIEIHRPGGDE